METLGIGLFGDLSYRDNFPALVSAAGFAYPMGKLGFPALGALGCRGRRQEIMGAPHVPSGP